VTARDTDLDGRRMVGVSNSADGEVGRATVFSYRQDGGVVWAEYGGGAVIRGYLVGTRDGDRLHFRYSHLGVDGLTSGGVCESIVEVLPDGRVRLHENWTWESRPGSGTSVVEELR